MKKKMLVLLVCCTLALSCVGCSSTSYQDATNTSVVTVSEANGYFTLITEWDDGYYTYQIVYANDTKVKYLIAYNRTYQQDTYGITPLYNTDGTLQVYNEK